MLFSRCIRGDAFIRTRVHNVHIARRSARDRLLMERALYALFDAECVLLPIVKKLAAVSQSAPRRLLVGNFAFSVREFLNFREIPIPKPKLVAYSHDRSERCAEAVNKGDDSHRRQDDASTLAY